MAPATLTAPIPIGMMPSHSPLITIDEFVSNYTDYTELDEGRIVEVPMPGGKHGGVEARMTGLLINFADAHSLGRVYSGDTFVVTKRNPDSVRGMDVAYVSYERWPEGNEVDDGPLVVSPELIVEVRSPSDRPGAIAKKVQEYLDVNVLIVAVIDAKLQTITLYRSGNTTETFAGDDELTFPEVLPGFSVPVKVLFK